MVFGFSSGLWEFGRVDWFGARGWKCGASGCFALELPLSLARLSFLMILDNVGSAFGISNFWQGQEKVKLLRFQLPNDSKYVDV